MNKKTNLLDRIRKNLIIYFFIMQVFGLLGSIMIGSTLDSGLSGYFIGYLIGVVLSFGGVIAF